MTFSMNSGFPLTDMFSRIEVRMGPFRTVLGEMFTRERTLGLNNDTWWAEYNYFVEHMACQINVCYRHEEHFLVHSTRFNEEVIRSMSDTRWGCVPPICIPMHQWLRAVREPVTIKTRLELLNDVLVMLDD